MNDRTKRLKVKLDGEFYMIRHKSNINDIGTPMSVNAYNRIYYSNEISTLKRDLTHLEQSNHIKNNMVCELEIKVIKHLDASILEEIESTKLVHSKAEDLSEI